MHLALEISQTRLAFFDLRKEGCTLLLEDVFLNLNETSCKETFTKNFELLPSSDKIDQITCSFIGPNFTLVPMHLFNVSKPDSLLQFASSDVIPKNDVEYNRLPEWNAVMVYQMPYWIKKMLIPKFPTVVIQHDLTHQLRFLNHGSLALPKIVVSLHHGMFTVSFRNNGEIVHISTQDFQTEDDILYHLLMCLEQVHVLGTIEFIVSTSIPKHLVTIEELTKKAKRNDKMKNQKWTLGLNKHIEYQLFCV
jgi:hypothetical protein